ncbi:MAG: CbtB-domain containing protein [Rhodospirillales bacterium]|nr:CbtB-domain containing protein [Rhodospirillales bacterium]
MQNQTSTAAALSSTTISTTVSKPVQLASAFLLGILLLYGAGLAQTSAAHNATHDVRHAMGFPCH